MQPQIQSLIATTTTPTVPEGAQAQKSDSIPTDNFATVLAANRSLREALQPTAQATHEEPLDGKADDQPDTHVGEGSDTPLLSKHTGNSDTLPTPHSEDDAELTRTADGQGNAFVSPDSESTDPLNASPKPPGTGGLPVPASVLAPLDSQQRHAATSLAGNALEASASTIVATALKPTASSSLWQTAVLPPDTAQANAAQPVTDGEATSAPLNQGVSTFPASQTRSAVNDPSLPNTPAPTTLAMPSVAPKTTKAGQPRLSVAESASAVQKATPGNQIVTTSIRDVEIPLRGSRNTPRSRYAATRWPFQRRVRPKQTSLNAAPQTWTKSAARRCDPGPRCR